MRKIMIAVMAAVAMMFVSCNKAQTGGDSDVKLEGRWNAYVQGTPTTVDEARVSFIFSGTNNVDIYIIAWGHHLKGTYEIKDGLMHFNLSRDKAQYAKTTEYFEWSAGNMDPETFELSEGYSWLDMDDETFQQDTDFLLHDHTWEQVSATEAKWGNMGGMKVLKQ